MTYRVEVHFVSQQARYECVPRVVWTDSIPGVSLMVDK